MAPMTSPPTNSSADPETALGGLLPGEPDDIRWQELEREIACEQLKVLRESMAMAAERIELLTSELRMLPWNWARIVRDARLALANGRTALAETGQRADEARLQLQAVSDELAAAESQLATGDRDRRSKGLGLLIRRRRRHDGTLLDLRMSHTLAGECLQAALERLQHAQLAVDTLEQALADVLSRRRRQRSILIQEIQSLEQERAREQAQCLDYERIVEEIEASLVRSREESMAPA